MKLRGAAWIIGTAVTLTAFSTVAACDDGEPISTNFNLDSGVVLPDATASDGGNTQSDGATPVDSGTPKDTGTDQDATLSAPACNDGKVDLGETCDPLEKCPTECPAQGCSLRTLENGGTCAAVCTVVAEISQCQNGDGCCPSTCTTADDNDCAAVCGNGLKEGNEKCDGPDCPTACPAIGCNIRKLQGTDCQRECVADTTITACISGDGCCAAGCSSGNDSDCAAGVCGNNTVDPPGEVCDKGIAAGQPGACPTACPAQGCNLFKLDNPDTCQAACTANGSITQCANNDGCCAPGCNNTNDNDCAPSCGNNVTEPPGELCDADCPTSCAQKACQLYVLQGSKATCDAKCVAGGQQTACKNADDCCPSGCTNANDSDCPAEPPKCGNGKLDPGETCDPSTGVPCPSCARGGCASGVTGSASTCDLVCNQPVDQCSGLKQDGCCPLASTDKAQCGASTDSDCGGSTWRVEHFQEEKPFGIKAGTCVNLVIDGIEAGSSYDVTTCSSKESADGDVSIKSVTGATTKLPPSKIEYGSNDDCTDEKYALPWRVGYTCKNLKGVTTMACVAEGTGGFIAKTSSRIVVTICADKADAVVPFNVFYNATTTPKIAVEAAKVP